MAPTASSSRRTSSRSRSSRSRSKETLRRTDSTLLRLTLDRETLCSRVRPLLLLLRDVVAERWRSGRISPAAAKTQQAQRHQLLLVLLENEVQRLRLWINPMMDPARGPVPAPRSAQSEVASRQLARLAWLVNPVVAIHLPERLKTQSVTSEVTRLVQKDPQRVQGLGDALAFFIGDSITSNIRPHLKVRQPLSASPRAD